MKNIKLLYTQWKKKCSAQFEHLKWNIQTKCKWNRPAIQINWKFSQSFSVFQCQLKFLKNEQVQIYVLISNVKRIIPLHWRDVFQWVITVPWVLITFRNWCDFTNLNFICTKSSYWGHQYAIRKYAVSKSSNVRYKKKKKRLTISNNWDFYFVHFTEKLFRENFILISLFTINIILISEGYI